MTSVPFRPVLYLKAGCPHCFKLRLFLLEAGMINRFKVREFTPGDAGEPVIREEIAPHFERVTFPSVQTEPGRFLRDSDAIIAHYAARGHVDLSGLPLTRTFSDTLLPRMQQLRAENRALEAELSRLQEQAA